MSDERTLQGKPEGTPIVKTTTYFYHIAVSFQRAYPEPIKEYTEFGVAIRTHATSDTYRAETIDFPAGQTVTRFELLLKASARVLDMTNTSRRRDGLMEFRPEDVRVTSFSCGRNEL